GRWVQAQRRRGRDPLPHGVVSPSLAASTDFGNVSYRLPGIHPVIRIAPSHVALHTREFAACAVSDEARLAAADGADALAATVLDGLHDPVLAAAVAEEFEAAGGAIDVPAYFDWPRGRLPTVPQPPPGGPAAVFRRSRPRGHRSPPLTVRSSVAPAGARRPPRPPSPRHEGSP